MIRKRLGDFCYHEGLCFQTEGPKCITEKVEQTISEYIKAREIFNRRKAAARFLVYIL
jgi:hypothetical protein